MLEWYLCQRLSAVGVWPLYDELYVDLLSFSIERGFFWTPEVHIFLLDGIDFGEGSGVGVMISVKPGAEDQIPCHGDSGGPLFSETGELIGILSFGAGDGGIGDYKFQQQNELSEQCLQTKNAFYVPIATNLEVINQMIKALDQNDISPIATK